MASFNLPPHPSFASHLRQCCLVGRKNGSSPWAEVGKAGSPDPAFWEKVLLELRFVSKLLEETDRNPKQWADFTFFGLSFVGVAGWGGVGGSRVIHLNMVAGTAVGGKLAGSHFGGQPRMQDPLKDEKHTIYEM